MRRSGRSRRRYPSWVLLVVFLATEIPLLSQIGPYPGGGGAGIPIPRLPRRGRHQKTDAPPEVQANYRGELTKLDDKSLVLKLRDGRILNMKRSGKTKFYKDSQEIKFSALNIGDRVSVDATEDQQGFLFAVKVTFEKAVAEEEPGKAASDSAPNSTSLPQSSVRDGDDGPPVLRRGIPSPKPERPESPPADRLSSASSSADRIETSRTQDSLIEKARAATASFSKTLPNFICQEFMARFARDSPISGWQPMDVVSAEVIYEDGQESYRNLKINERPTERKMEELSGSWSTGEFATTLSDLFHPATAAQFRLGGESSLVGLQARLYDFEVKKENSHWIVQMGSQSIKPAYKGSVWIDKESGRVLRLEMQARDLPEGFPMDTVESAVDYSFVRIGGQSVLLPVHAESLGCQRGTRSCSRNVIDFRNYRKYSADSRIIFDQ